MRTVTTARHFIDAAHQSASQYKSTREALRKARLEEQRAHEREKKKREKEFERAKAKEKTAEDRKRKKAEKDAAKAATAAAEAERKANENEREDSTAARRRGKGSAELTNEDLPILVNRYGQEVPVVDTMEKICASSLTCDPVIWRARRLPLKKILESSGLSSKNATNANMMLQAELKGFISESAERFENDPAKSKCTKCCSDQAQAINEALTFEYAIRQAWDEAANDSEAIQAREPCLVVERPELQQAMDRIVAETEIKAAKAQADGNPPDPCAVAHASASRQEATSFSKLHMLALRKGSTFSGVMPGLFPHLIFQSEGNRAMALVAIAEVTQNCILCFYSLIFMCSFL